MRSFSGQMAWRWFRQASRGTRVALVILFVGVATLSCDSPTAPRNQKAELVLSATGLAADATAIVRIDGAAGTSVTLAGTDTAVATLAPGPYTITALPGSSATDQYAPSTATAQSVMLTGGRNPYPLHYALATGRANVTLGGVPTGAQGAVTLTGPSGTISTTSSKLLTMLTPGTYAVTAAPIVADSNRYVAQLAPGSVTIAASTTPSEVSATYQLATGSVTFTATGLPSGATPSATLVAADGSQRTIATNQTAHALAPGAYTLTAPSVATGGVTYLPAPASQAVAVLASTTPTAANVSYGIAQGALALTISGLPSGTAGAVTVTGPLSYTKTVTTSTTIAALPAGTYTVTATSVSGSDTYEPTTASQTVTVGIGTTATTTVSYVPLRRALIVAPSGLPTGAKARVIVTGAGVQDTVTGLDTLLLVPGPYVVSATAVVDSGNTYVGSPETQSDTLRSTSTTPVTAAVRYAIVYGSLTLAVTGLPASTADTLTITGPNAFSRVLTAPGTLTSLALGTYTVAAKGAVANGTRYLPTPTTQSTTLALGATTATDSITYAAVTTGTLAVQVSGLPSGGAASIAVTGPNGYSQTLTGSQQLAGVALGTYTITPASVRISGALYLSSAPVTATLTSVVDTASAVVTYAPAPGTLTVTTSGLPTGATPNATVTGPDGFTQTITSTSQTLTTLALGTYTITARPDTVTSAVYEPTVGVQTVSLTTDTTSRSATVTYAPTGASLVIAVSGLPTGGQAAIQVAGPNAYSQQVTGSQTLGALADGVYTLTASPVVINGQTYGPVPTSVTDTLSSTVRSASATFTYTLVQGSLALTVSGVPSGGVGNVRIVGPNSFDSTYTASTVLSNLGLGTYTITASNVTISGQTYIASPATQADTLTLSARTGAATVTYAATGRLTVVTSGVPTGTAASITVSGPSGTSTVAVTGSYTWVNTAPGSYTVTPGGSVQLTTGNLHGSPASQAVTVSSGATTVDTVVFVPSLNLTVASAYLTQATQAADGSIPLIANRAGALRVLLQANETNIVAPTVRARVYQNGSLVSTLTATAPSGVSVTPSDGSYASALNFALPSSVVQAGVSVLVDIDPSSALTETSRADNTWPTNGTAYAASVHTAPDFNVTFVPVQQSVNGTLGSVTTGNASGYLDLARRVWPLATVTSQVHAVYTTTAPALQANDGNGAWTTILSEMQALRTAEGTGRFYYGVVHPTYTAGIVGLGYVGAPAAIGWDDANDFAHTAAHEWGHNFNRQHAPCGSVSGPDPSYPYTGGTIGVPGLDIATSTFHGPSDSDIMGYCSRYWVSDYNYRAVLTFRESNPSADIVPLFDRTAAMGTTGDTRLLVWGRMGRHGLVLEPAFVVDAPASVPADGGPALLELLDASGGVIRALRFRPTAIADAADSSFAFALPLSSAELASLASIRLSVAGQQVSRRMAADDAQAPGVSLERRGGAVALHWDARQHPMLLVRDAATGEVLSFARGGQAVMRTGARTMRIDVPDRPQTRGRQLAVPQ